MMRLELDAKNKILGERYYLHHLISQSSHSKLFLATDLMINDRKCAIKQLYPNYYPIEIRSEVESAFVREAKILKHLAPKHHQICQFYSYFFDAGNQYIVQEWIEGTTLATRLNRESKLSESEIKTILLDVLRALKYIHGRGIVHNDIKPSNIILRLSDNLPVLVDFGAARKIDTYSGKNVLGTPGYMSWEQAMGKTAINNDLYSLGITTISLLTGESPQSANFNSGSENLWHQAKKAFDSRLVEAIDRAVAPAGEQRFTSTAAMLEMLEPSEKKAISLPQTSTPVSPKSKLFKTNLVFWIILAISSIGLGLRLLDLQLDTKPPTATIDFSKNDYWQDLLTRDRPNLPVMERTENIQQHNIWHNIIFAPGTAKNKILQTLGEPLWRKRGFWANSTAWSYENIVAQGFDIGYIFDRQTSQLRQAELAVPPTTELSIIQSAMNSFLVEEQSTRDIEQGLQSVYLRQQSSYSFTVGNLKGVVQRNDFDRIYLAVWEADFH